MQTLRDWLADAELAEVLLDALILKATLRDGGKLLSLVLEVGTDDDEE